MHGTAEAQEGAHHQRVAQGVLLDGLHHVGLLTDLPVEGLHGFTEEKHAHRPRQQSPGKNQKEPRVPQQQHQRRSRHPDQQGNQAGDQVCQPGGDDVYIVVQVAAQLPQAVLLEGSVLGMEQALVQLPLHVGLHPKTHPVVDVGV